MAKNDAWTQSQAATLKNLENQIGQLATELRNIPQGTLSSDTENPRNLGKEHIKTVALRSGKILEPRVIDVEDELVEKGEVNKLLKSLHQKSQNLQRLTR